MASTEVLDPDQQAYRQHFKIIDKYLVEYELEEVLDVQDPTKKTKRGYIVYIDQANDCDWKDERDHNVIFGPDGRKEFASAIGKLNVAHALPCSNLLEHEMLIFKKMIGAGYALALNGNFDSIDSLIAEATQYLKSRNKEQSRRFFLESSGIMAIITIVSWGFVTLCKSICYQDWIAGVCMGVLGAFVSIWMRYGRMSFTGLSSKYLHYLEAVSRMFVGGIFALVVLYAVSCHLLFSDMNSTYHEYAFPIAGFLSGFSERLVPSLMERMYNKEDNKEQDE